MGSGNGLTSKQERKVNVKKQNYKMMCNLTLDGFEIQGLHYRGISSYTSSNQ